MKWTGDTFFLGHSCEYSLYFLAHIHQNVHWVTNALYISYKIIVLWFIKQFKLVRWILINKANPITPLATLALEYQGGSCWKWGKDWVWEKAGCGEADSQWPDWRDLKSRAVPRVFPSTSAVSGICQGQGQLHGCATWAVTQDSTCDLWRALPLLSWNSDWFTFELV